MYSCGGDEVCLKPGDENDVDDDDDDDLDIDVDDEEGLDFDHDGQLLLGVLYGGGRGDAGRGRQKRGRSYQLF